MKLLITGAHGQLGKTLTPLLERQGIAFHACNRQQLDICSHEKVHAVLQQYQPSCVINLAAYTAVDKAEQHMQEAMHTNSDAAAILACQCAEHEIPLLHLSTDYVFDGHSKHPYQEQDSCHPLNVYGRSKQDGECEIRQNLHAHIILRVSSVFSAYGHNFVKTMLRLGQERPQLSVVNDQISCPTATIDIALAILDIVEQIEVGNRAWGTYHYCSKDPVSWYDFAQHIFDDARQYQSLAVESVEPISSSQFVTVAQRPLYSVLNCAKIDASFGIGQPSWQQSLSELISQVFNDESL